jgi:hypothetical protein
MNRKPAKLEIMAAACLLVAVLLTVGTASAQGPVRPLAQEYTVIYESPDPERVFCYTPGLAMLPGGRIVATLDLGGPGVADLPFPKWERGESGYAWTGKVFTSDDHGATWTHRTDFPYMHARPFVVGTTLYVLGQAADLQIIRSDDGGETWTAPAALTEGENWHQSACNVHYANGCVYLVMERRMGDAIRSWRVGELAPVLMRGRIGDDLTLRANWTFADPLPFFDTIPDVETEPDIDFFGVPFYPAAYPKGHLAAEGRNSAPIGWLETNVVQFTDPGHYWHDPSGRTFHLYMRAHTGGTGYAALAKAVEQGDTPGTGPIHTMLETVPSGRRMLYLPLPGGQMRFHILFDEPTGLFWLLSSQATDSMTRAELLGPDRFNLPNNERHRLQLHFSKNGVDWCFAGLVATGKTPRQARHYASMLVDGDNLLVLSRSGDHRAHGAHDGNIITLHTVKNFRELVY